MALGALLMVAPAAQAGTDLLEFIPDGRYGRTWNTYSLSWQTGAPPMSGNVSTLKDGAGTTRIYSRSDYGKLIETLPDHQAGRIWNSYEIPAGDFPITGDPGALFDSWGRPHIFVRNSTNAMIESLAGPNGWEAYDKTLETGAQIAGRPAPFNDAQGLTRVYARSTGGALLEFIPDNIGGRLWNVYNLSAETGVYIAGDPTVIKDSSGSVRIYARNSAGQLIETLPDFQNGRTWNSYNLSSYIGAPPLRGNVATAQDGTGRVHIFGRTDTGALMEVVPDFKNGRTWNWYLLPKGDYPLAYDPGAIYIGGRFRVYSRNSTYALIETISNDGPNGAWGAYDLTLETGARIVGQPRPVSDSSGRVRVYALAKPVSSYPTSVAYGGADESVNTLAELNNLGGAFDNAASDADAQRLQEGLSPGDQERYARYLSDPNGVPPQADATDEETPTSTDLKSFESTEATTLAASTYRCKTVRLVDEKWGVYHRYKGRFCYSRTRKKVQYGGTNYTYFEKKKRGALGQFEITSNLDPSPQIDPADGGVVMGRNSLLKSCVPLKAYCFDVRDLFRIRGYYDGSYKWRVNGSTGTVL